MNPHDINYHLMGIPMAVLIQIKQELGIDKDFLAVTEQEKERIVATYQAKIQQESLHNISNSTDQAPDSSATPAPENHGGSEGSVGEHNTTPSSSSTEGVGSPSVGSSLDEFNDTMFSREGDINFERDFGQWFIPDDGFGPGEVPSMRKQYPDFLHSGNSRESNWTA
ncbi:hypothetical protein Hypma_000244 [Hypsizygus marmoreus]|uniref:Uncharacterized protein n=1 Tax=Hypsizygus marmoreus TaxID=39966 RepID=A0A369J9D4_HYPMA|nr:hypothetical protein Hypma_000244 [Hypsizygus marmoreus]